MILDYLRYICQGDDVITTILDSLYREALQCERKEYSRVIDFAELKQKLGSVWPYESHDLIHMFIFLESYLDVNGEDEEGIFTYEEDMTYKLSPVTNKLRRVKRIFCTLKVKQLEEHVERCRAEEERVSKNNKRATDMRLPATLTLADWIATLYVRWSCAYCLGRYEVLEHIIPLTFPDSGTTITNCVPSCSRCNSLKGPYHPDRMPSGIKSKIGEPLERVRKQTELLVQYAKHREEYAHGIK